VILEKLEIEQRFYKPLRLFLAQFALHQNNQIWPVAYDHSATIDSGRMNSHKGLFHHCQIVGYMVLFQSRAGSLVTTYWVLKKTAFNELLLEGKLSFKTNVEKTLF